MYDKKIECPVCFMEIYIDEDDWQDMESYHEIECSFCGLLSDKSEWKEIEED